MLVLSMAYEPVEQTWNICSILAMDVIMRAFIFANYFGVNKYNNALIAGLLQ